MIALNPIPEAVAALGKSLSHAKQPSYSVWICDPWCRTPWYTAELARALDASGHAVRLASPSYQPEPEYFRSQGLSPRPGILNVAPYCGQISERFLRPLRLAEYGINTVALGFAAASSPPQIVHQQQCVLLEHGWKIELAFLRWCRKQGAHVVYTAHNVLPHRLKPFHAEIHAELYRIPDALICHDSEAARTIHEKFRIDRSRIHVIPHGPLFAEIPACSPAECRHVLRIDPDRQVFLSLGVLSPYKGLDLLLEAWAELLRRDRSIRRPLLVIAGKGPDAEKERLQRIAAMLGLDPSSVRLDLEYIPTARIPTYLHAADVLLYPYRAITTSGALLTGLNYRKPIIASDLAAFRNYLHPGVNAITVPPGNKSALADAIAALRESDLFARLAKGSRNNHLLQVQWSEIAAQTAQVYASLVT